MNARELATVICLTMIISPATAGVGQNVAPDTSADDCIGQLTDLVDYLKETAEIEGVVLSVENAEKSTILCYPDFSQRLQCVDGVLQIDFHNPKTD